MQNFQSFKYMTDCQNRYGAIRQCHFNFKHVRRKHMQTQTSIIATRYEEGERKRRKERRRANEREATILKPLRSAGENYRIGEKGNEKCDREKKKERVKWSDLEWEWAHNLAQWLMLLGARREEGRHADCEIPREQDKNNGRIK